MNQLLILRYAATWRAFLQNPRIDVYSIACGATELGLGVQLLLQVNAQLGSGVLQLVQVGLVLLLVLNLVLQSLKGSHGSRVVIDSSASLQRFLDDGWRRNQVIRETVVQHSLDLEQVVGVLELLFVSGVSISELRKNTRCSHCNNTKSNIPGSKLFKSLFLVVVGRIHSDLGERDSGHRRHSASRSDKGSGSGGRTESGGDHWW